MEPEFIAHLIGYPLDLHRVGDIGSDCHRRLVVGFLDIGDLHGLLVGVPVVHDERCSAMIEVEGESFSRFPGRAGDGTCLIGQWPTIKWFEALC